MASDVFQEWNIQTSLLSKLGKYNQKEKKLFQEVKWLHNNFISNNTYCKVFYRLMPVLISSNKETTFFSLTTWKRNEKEILFSTFHSSNTSGSCNGM
jgi:hypothetical protein